jgi:hypothetical protein
VKLVKLSVTAITGSQGVERGIREVYETIDELSDRVSKLELSADFRFLMISLLDKPSGHFEDVSSRKTILHLEVGYDEAAFEFPLNHSRIVNHLGECIRLAVSESKLSKGDKEMIVREIEGWAKSP